MRLEEHCPCGGSITVNFESGTTYGSGARLAQEAREQVEKWRRAHRPCLKTRQGQPEPKPGA